MFFENTGLFCFDEAFHYLGALCLSEVAFDNGLEFAFGGYLDIGERHEIYEEGAFLIPFGMENTFIFCE